MNRQWEQEIMNGAERYSDQEAQLMGFPGEQMDIKGEGKRNCEKFQISDLGSSKCFFFCFCFLLKREESWFQRRQTILNTNI